MDAQDLREEREAMTGMAVHVEIAPGVRAWVIRDTPEVPTDAEAAKAEPEETPHGEDVAAEGDEYRAAMGRLAKDIFDALSADIDDVFGYDPSRSETVTMDLVDALEQRTKKVIEERLPGAEQAILRLAAEAYMKGTAGAADLVRKQGVGLDIGLDEPDQAALEAMAEESIGAMRNTLYIGDRDSYLARVKAISRQASEEGWTTSRLADELRRQLDPNRQFFADYMWERIARTDAARFVTTGRLTAYERFGIEKVRWVAASDAIDVCAENDGQVYTVEEAEGQIPAHPSCRCAFAPVVG